MNNDKPKEEKPLPAGAGNVNKAALEQSIKDKEKALKNNQTVKK